MLMVRTYRFIGRDAVSRTQLSHQLVCNLIVGGYAFLLNLLTYLHGEMSQAFPILVPSSAAPVGEKNRVNKMICWAHLTAFRVRSPRPLQKYWNSRSTFIVFFLCTEHICVWNQKMNMRREIRVSDFTSWYLLLEMLNNIKHFVSNHAVFQVS